MTEKKRGRHPLPKHLLKEKVIQTTLTIKDKNQLQKIADENDLDLSVFIRQKLIIPLLKDIEKEE